VSHFEIPAGHRKHAKRMRRVMTDAELKLWNELRAHRLVGLGFRRQMPIAGYIVDFACSEGKLIVEVDGLQHGEEAALRHDNERTMRLEALGWTVLRVWNYDVLTNIDGVCDAIVRAAGVEKCK
jgi:very-short-patch-repair endonuclease